MEQPDHVCHVSDETAPESNTQQSAAPKRIPPRAGRRLDMKSLRFAVHGWWLGNPLVYQPGTVDLCAVARKLADAGAASGTLIVGDERDTEQTLPDDDATCHDFIQAVLILRLPMPHALLGKIAAVAVAEVAEAMIGQTCAVQQEWDVIIHDGQSRPRLCHITVEDRSGVSFLGLRLALEPLWVAGQGASQPPTALLTRPDWREIFLARVLHTIDVRLHSMLRAKSDAEQAGS